MTDCIVTGLFFHTNSEETFYTFRKYKKTGFIEMELGVCPGINDIGSYEYSYLYANRYNLIYICQKYEEFIKNPLYATLYKLSLILSKPGNRLITKIIWKCIRITKEYEEFEYEDKNEDNLIETEWYYKDEAKQIIYQNRLEKCFELVCDILETEYKNIQLDIYLYNQDIKYQNQLINIVSIIRNSCLDDNSVETIGKYL
jgi:hypothetical protein